MGQRIWILPKRERDLNLEVFQVHTHRHSAPPNPSSASSSSSSSSSSASTPRIKTGTGTRPVYPTTWPLPDNPIWKSIPHLKNPNAHLSQLPTEMILLIMKYTRNPVTNTCLGLACSRLYIIHYAANGPTNMCLISPVWWEEIEDSWWHRRCLGFPPTRVQCIPLYQMIEEFMAPGWIYERRSGTYRTPQAVEAENEKWRLRSEKDEREKAKKLRAERGWESAAKMGSGREMEEETSDAKKGAQETVATVREGTAKVCETC